MDSNSPPISFASFLSVIRSLLVLASLIWTLPTVAQTVPAAVFGQAAQQVAVGAKHSCALASDGAVHCWGQNQNGQLGDGTTRDSNIPKPVAGLVGRVAAIAAGDNHSCALNTDGAVTCWGANVNGQLGSGGVVDSSSPTAVGTLNRGVAAITAGASHTCALTTKGAVYCWGRNDQGQLGEATFTLSATPRLTTGLSKGVAAIAAGADHTCALTNSGTVKCWGRNANAQLGAGGTSDSNIPVVVPGLTQAKAIATGVDHTCALMVAGEMKCWGANSDGQLGGGTTSSRSAPSTVSGLATDVQSIAAGKRHTCAVAGNGSGQCWGGNGSGELGDGTNTATSTPRAVPEVPGGLVAISTKQSHSCALSTVGGVKCWGDNSQGQLGDGSTANSNGLRDVAFFSSGVAKIAVGGSHTCALTLAAAVHCWGRNQFGQIGDGTTTNSSAAKPVNGLGRGVIAITAGLYHTCALTQVGGVQCWGRNEVGQLGDGAGADSSSPKPVTGLASDVTAIAAGSYHTCALTASGEIQCWGYNGNGQLGDGTIDAASSPRQVIGLAGTVKSIGAGLYHTCALNTAGAVQCWGDNARGQLGDNAVVQVSVPNAATGLASGVAAIALGDEHTCSLSTTGLVSCWGYNNVGQLGDGTTTNRDRPEPVNGLGAGVKALTAGGSHTCALSSNGGIECWGSNDKGELGDGATNHTSSPKTVTTVTSGVVAVVAGRQATCALTSSGTVPCWGNNQYLQLGSSNRSTRSVRSIGASAQAIAFSATLPRVDSASSLFATASSGLPVTFESWTPDVCSVIGVTLTVMPGTASQWCGLIARQAGGDNASDEGFVAARPKTQLLLVQGVVPSAPTNVTAIAGNAQASVSWTRPSSDGGSAITGYTVTAVADPSKTCAVHDATPLPTTCVVPSLSNGSSYSFTVKAINLVGESASSAASAMVDLPRPVTLDSADSGAADSTFKPSDVAITVTDPRQPVVIGAGSGGGTITLPYGGTAPIKFQVTMNGQPMLVEALPGTQLRVVQVDGQHVLDLMTLQGWASVASSRVGQAMALAGQLLLRSGHSHTVFQAKPRAAAVDVGSLIPPAGSLPAVGIDGLQAGERIQLNASGAVAAITLSSLEGNTQQAGDVMGFTALPASVRVDGRAFAQLHGPIARLSGLSLTNGLESTPWGVLMVRDSKQLYQLLPTHPVTVDAREADGIAFTPLGLLRWVRGGVIVQFAPAVADLTGLANAVTTALPDAQILLGAEGVLQLNTGGRTYVLRPGWTGGGVSSIGTSRIGVDEQGRIFYQQNSQAAHQLLIPSLLSYAQANTILTTALPGASLAVDLGNDGAIAMTWGGQRWRLVPQWILPEGPTAQSLSSTTPWWMGRDSSLYLKLGTQVQGLRIAQ